MIFQKSSTDGYGEILTRQKLNNPIDSTYYFFSQSMPILTEKIEKCDSTESCSSKPVWGQFHFFPGENQLTSGQKQLTSGSISEMNSKMVKQSNPYVSTSFTTTTIGTNAEVASSFYSAPQW